MALACSPANAATMAFTGSATATASVVPDASCAPLPFRGTIAAGNSSGNSNLGAFTYAHKVCTQGATGPVSGMFEIVFADGAITGGLEGFSVARPGVPGLFDQTFNYIINGGSGIFGGATGAFTNVGTVDVRGGPPSRLSLNFHGIIQTAAVPEPSTWVVLLLGFGLIGGAMRTTRKRGNLSVSYL